jgi:hypothetical protein
VCELKFCFELGKNATKTFETLKTALGQLKIGKQVVVFEIRKRYDHCGRRRKLPGAMTVKRHENMESVNEVVLTNAIMHASEVANLARISSM